MNRNHTAPEPTQESPVLAERRDKLNALREACAAAGTPAFPNHWKPRDHAADLQHRHGATPNDELEPQSVQAVVAGRLMLKRLMGKASFATLQDGSGRLQLFVSKDGLGDAAYEAFKRLDLGDIVGASGTLFRTRTGELSLKVTTLQLLTKSLRPLPDKFHGLADQEQKYRQRYVDLLADEDARARFVARSKAVASIRQFMIEHRFLEVETPMLHPIPGGANAKPFATHHNALDQQMFLRIAPELYLKRLLVGGFERVFEINRNFRNEGISVRHNPEFTMMEFYAAYWDYRDVMDYTEAVIRHAARHTAGSALLTYQGREVDLDAPFARLSIRDALLRHVPDLDPARHPGQIDDAGWLRTMLNSVGREAPAHWKLPELQFAVFEDWVEHELWQPTFIVDHPVEVSPLARAADADPTRTERFELYITGREIANGFSELNDAEHQAARFAAQAANRSAGDEEAMYYDADFIRALEVGMPPAGGCGIGIDRLVMLLTDAPSIRDVILFPALRRE